MVDAILIHMLQAPLGLQDWTNLLEDTVEI